MAIHYIESIRKDVDIIKDFIKRLSDGGREYVYVDTETSGLDPFTDFLLLFQVAIDKDVYVFHRGKVGKEFITSLIKRINDLGLTFVAHNVKFDAKFIRTDTGLWLNRVYDTMIGESVLQAGVGKQFYSLGELTNKYCGTPLDKDDRLSFVGMSPSDDFTEQQIVYSATDVLYLKSIHREQLEQAEKNFLIPTINLEMEVLPVVADMEYQGISLDVEYWKNLAGDAMLKCSQAENRTKVLILEGVDKSKYNNALELANALCIPVKTKRDQKALETITDPKAIDGWVLENFNMASHKQLLTSLRLTGIDVKNTNEKTLNKVTDNEIIESILTFREFQKQVTTYGNNIIDLIHPVTKRIHTDFLTNGTKTGRFSSQNPNMQNLPRSGGYREGFIPRDGFSFIAMDYSQQEYRLVGALSGEEKIIEAYKAGSDMHTATAANRFKKPLEDVTSEERGYGKTMNFAILYGTTEYGLKKNFSTTVEDARQMLQDFFDGYPRLHKFMEAVSEKVLELGFSVTPLGRRRYFKERPVFATPDEIERYESQIKREGFNMVIQGGGADVTKRAMILMYKNNPFGDNFKLILQVHDEVVVEAHDSILDEAASFMEKCMVDAFQPLLGEIPAKVDYKILKRWSK